MDGRQRWPAAIAVGSGMLLMLAVVHAAWLCDDAFITLRTVDNWVGGHGLRWNVDERVQAFTHPAWLFLVTLAYLPAHSWNMALLAPAIVLTFAFIALLIGVARDRVLAAGACMLLLASKGFVEFSTSGLENPLVHLLLLGYAVCGEYTLRTGCKLWRPLCCATLLLCTRLDLLWLIAPSLVAATWFGRKEVRRARTWLALTPLVAWETFSLLYYGFPFPNTAYAKLNTGVPGAEAIAQGLTYAWANLKYDPPTILGSALIAVIALVGRRRWPMLLALGILLWDGYLIRIGGDFMLGRLMTPALVAALLLLPEIVPARIGPPVAALGALVALGSVALPRSALLGAPRVADASWLAEHVTDERALSFDFTGLFRAAHPEGPREHPYATGVLARMGLGERVFPARSIGFAGYFAGPEAHIVDEFALAEPLLARLPADPAWNPGHFERRLPAGYLATLASGHNQLADATLARHYDILASIIRDPLLASARLKRVLRWNVRSAVVYPYDYQVRQVPLVEFASAPAGGASVRGKHVFATDRQGLAILFPRPTALRKASLALGQDDHYLVAFRRGGRVLWSTWLAPLSADPRTLGMQSVAAPEAFLVDSLLIRGRRGDHRYHVGAASFE